MLFSLKLWHLCVFIINQSYSVKHMQTQTKILHCHINFKRTLITEHNKNQAHVQNDTKLSWSWYLHDNVCFAAKCCVSITNGINSLQPDCTRAAHTHSHKQHNFYSGLWNMLELHHDFWSWNACDGFITCRKHSQNNSKLLIYSRTEEPWEKVLAYL